MGRLRPFKCDRCGKRFGTLHGAQKHIEGFHKPEVAAKAQVIRVETTDRSHPDREWEFLHQSKGLPW